MTDITELTAEKLEEIRQRYRPTEVPKCHICGAEMTIQRMSASRITYGCSGATYDETGCHYAPGRSIADEHYVDSRITVVDVSDPDVLAMVEALEKTQPSPVNGIDPASGQDSSVEVRFVAPPGYVIVPKDVSPEQLRAFQLKTKIGAYVTANWSGAYDSLRELWDVAIAHCPKIKTMD